MKLRLLHVITILFAIGLFVQAQTDHGKFLTGGEIDLTASGDQTVLRLTPKCAYFLQEKLALGILMEYNSVRSNDIVNKRSDINIGPLMRYYLTDIGRNLSLYGQSDLVFGSARIGEGTSSSQIRFGAGPGLNIFVSRNLAFNILMQYRFLKLKSESGKSNLGLSFGFDIFL